MNRFEEFMARKRNEYGEKFDPSDLRPGFVRWFNSGERIRVAHGEHVRTGCLGVTTGWRPAFLLMHRSSDYGSWDVLGSGDLVVAVKSGREYVAVSGG